MDYQPADLTSGRAPPVPVGGSRSTLTGPVCSLLPDPLAGGCHEFNVAEKHHFLFFLGTFEAALNKGTIGRHFGDHSTLKK